MPDDTTPPAAPPGPPSTRPSGERAPLFDANWPLLATIVAVLAALLGAIGWLNNASVRFDRTERSVAEHTEQFKLLAAQVEAAKSEMSGLRTQGARIEAKQDVMLDQLRGLTERRENAR